MGERQGLPWLSSQLPAYRPCRVPPTIHPSAANLSTHPSLLSVADAVLYQRTYFTAVMWAYLLGLGMAFGVSTRVACVLLGYGCCCRSGECVRLGLGSAGQ